MAATAIRNPILPGFNPDPSICRVGDDFYIATSTFEWYPGVRIHHSRDLRNWRLASCPLDRPELLNMLGNPDSCGIWAPCLSFCDGLFYLVYTDVKRYDGNFKDTHNYLTTCESIDGVWSDPVHLNSSGFDPSLFHDDDGRKWLLNMVWDHRPGRNRFAGIALQEYSPVRQRLVGGRSIVFSGTELGCTEAPHLYKRGGYHYLITAEGGTGYNHAVTAARSVSIKGPYEPDPAGPVVTSRHDPAWPLQRAGHADLVETREGELFMVHLASRPLPGTRLSPLGRETAIQRLEYTDDGWFRLADGHVLPRLEIEPPALPRAKAASALSRGTLPSAPPHGAPSSAPPSHDQSSATPHRKHLSALVHDDFDDERLDLAYQWLRTPWPGEFMSLSERPGWLRLRGMESPGSLYRQALIARRLTAPRCRATTCVEFQPDNFQQLAGLIVYYNSSKFHYLYLSTQAGVGRHLAIMSCEAEPTLDVIYPLKDRPVPLPDTGRVFLRADIDGPNLAFSWSKDGIDWTALDRTLDMRFLTDEYGGDSRIQFTGTFIGLCCNDLTGARRHADFDYLELRNEP